MSGEAIAAPRRGGAERWLPLASFAMCTFYVFLLGFLTLWVVVPAAVMRWDPMLVSSGSMSPLIRVGDIVLIDEHDGGSLDTGTVITYRDMSRGGVLVTHRIAAVNDDGSYTTKGDANRSNDVAPVRPEDIEGVGRLLVPMIGIPLGWLTSSQLVTFLLWLCTTLVAVLVATRTPERDEDDGDDDLTGAPTRAPRPVGFRRALRLVNLPALLGASVTRIAVSLSARVGPAEMPSPVRAWTPTLLAAAATLAMGAEPLGILAGATSLTVALGLDPKGPEIPIGRWWRMLRRFGATSRLAWWRPDDLGRLPAFRPAFAGIAVVGILVVSLVPRTEAAFTASTSVTGSGWQAGTWATVAPSDMSIPACRRSGSAIEVDLRWQPVAPEPDGYRLEMATDSPEAWGSVGTTTSTSHTMKGLANNVWYYFRVRSVVDVTTSPPSNVVGVRIIGMTCEFYPSP